MPTIVIETSSVCLSTNARIIFFDLLFNASPTKKITEIIFDKKKYVVKLNKGQVIFIPYQFSEKTSIQLSLINTAIQEILDSNLDIAAKEYPFGFVFTLSGYEKHIDISKTKVSKIHSSEAQEIIDFYNTKFNTKLKSCHSWLKNFIFWRETYTLDEIKQAVDNLDHPNWWAKTSPTLDLLFRTKNKNGDCDYIQQILLLKTATQQSSSITLSRKNYQTNEDFILDVQWHRENMKHVNLIVES